MPRYQFNLVLGQHAHIDEAREELPDHEAARRRATDLAGEILRDEDGSLPPGSHWQLEVLDEAGKQLFWIEVITGPNVKTDGG